jgi:hypothetical protein
MRKPLPHPEPPATLPGAPEARRYEPPRLTGKRSLENVTLASPGTTPLGGSTGAPDGGWIGHP